MGNCEFATNAMLKSSVHLANYRNQILFFIKVLDSEFQIIKSPDQDFNEMVMQTYTQDI